MRKVASLSPFLLASIGVGAGLLFNAAACAGEAMFGYVYTTDTLPQGNVDVQQWATQRVQRPEGSYQSSQFRTELEYGLTDRLQGALFLNYSDLRASGQDDVRRLDGVSAEVLYRVLSPYLEPVGLAVSFRPDYGARARGGEVKLIGQSTFLDDRLVTAVNLAANVSKKRGVETWQPGTSLELSLGATYRFAAGTSAGLEFRVDDEFAGYGVSSGKRQSRSMYLGPSFHYADRSWFLTVSVLEQLPYARAFNAASPTDVVGGRFYGNGHAKYDGVRLKLGYVFF